jgi:hypothetical protein
MVSGGAMSADGLGPRTEEVERGKSRGARSAVAVRAVCGGEIVRRRGIARGSANCVERLTCSKAHMSAETFGRGSATKEAT